MNKKMLVVALAAFSLGALYACSGGETKREICNNGVDDDANGKTDCADPDCAGQAECVGNMDAGYFGECAKCGNTCGGQEECQSYNYLDDRPIPYCVQGRCTAVEKFVQVRVFLNTKDNWNGALDPKSGSTRFIKKTARDGSAVTCARVAATASDKTKPAAIEDSKEYVIQGLDVSPITNPQLGQGVTYTFVNTQTGGDYLIWAELWYGPRNSTTGLPSGNREGWGCFEAAADVGAPITLEDNCPSTTSDAGTCRVFTLVMPAPQ